MATLQYGPGDEPIPGSGYRVVSFLGRGGFGEVWKARAPGGAETALKIIRLGGREGRKELRALQLVKRIRHPNLVPIFGFWLKGKDGLVLDDASIQAADVMVEPSASLTKTMFVPGVPAPDAAQELIIAMGLGDKSLFDRLEECRNEGMPGIPQKELLGYLEDCAEAIDFLNRPIHDLGMGRAAIQHCDIKPHNLMIVGGCAQVCDFGLARMMGCDRATTAAGSIAYAAPETLIENQPSSSTDQYSLAITYYELKTSKLPFPDDSLVAILDAKREEKLDFSDLPAVEQCVLRRATLRNPDERYTSCREMIEALRDATSRADRPLVRRARRSLLPWVVAFLVLGISAGGAWFAWLRPWPFGQPAAVALAPSPAPSLVQVPDRPKIVEHGAGHGLEAVLNKDTDHDSGGAKTVSHSGNEISKQGTAGFKPIETAGKEGLAAKHFQHGCELLDSRRYDEAIDEFKQTILLDPEGTDKRPKYGEAYLERGTQTLSNRDFVAAIPDLEQAAKFMPKEAKVFSRLGAAWSGQKHWDKAVESYTAAIEIEPHPLDYEARGRAYRALRSLDNAITDFRQSVELNPKNAQAYAELGDAYLDKENPERAIPELSKAVQICRGDPKANFREFSACHLRAYAYLKLGKTDEAAADLERVFDLAQSDQDRAGSHDLFYALSVKLAEAKRYADAVRWIKKAIELAPDEATRNTYRERLKTYSAQPAPVSPPHPNS